MKILVVDDSMFVRQCIKKYLLEYDSSFEIVTGSSGEEGLDLYNKENPDLIISDLLMPGMSGGDLIKEIRKNNQDINIIVCTADVQKTVKEEIESMHVFAFLNKPINKDKVFNTLSELRGK